MKKNQNDETNILGHSGLLLLRTFGNHFYFTYRPDCFWDLWLYKKINIMSIDFGGAGSSPIAYPLEVVYVSMSFDITIAIIRDSEGRDLPIKGIAPQYADPFCEYLNSFQRVIEPKEDAFEIFKKSDTYLEMAAKTEEDNNMAEAYIEKLGQLFGLPRQKHYDSVFGSGAKIMCFSVFGKQTGLVSSVWPEEMILRRFGEMLKEFGRNEKVAAFIELLKIN